MTGAAGLYQACEVMPQAACLGDLGDDAMDKVGRHGWTPGCLRRAAPRSWSFSGLKGEAEPDPDERSFSPRQGFRAGEGVAGLTGAT